MDGTNQGAPAHAARQETGAGEWLLWTTMQTVLPPHSPPPPTDPTRHAGSTSRLATIAGDIKLSHSVFALPFAVLATFLAARDSAPEEASTWQKIPSWIQIALIVAAMIFARTYAMLANRYFDRDIDATNPRTKNRALPAGRLTPRDVLIAMAASAMGLVIVAAGFGILFENWWPTVFSPVVLIWLGAYGLMKRFTFWCHFFLGAALALSPLAAGLAIHPGYLAEQTLWWLAGFVLLWVGGFDVIYALQDIDADRRDGLHSIPAKLGPTRSLMLAKLSHLAALFMLMKTGVSSTYLNDLFFAGFLIVGLLLIIEHVAASRGRFSMAFFTVNGLISLILGGLGIADALLS